MADLNELLGEELFNQVSEKLGDTKLIINDGNYIPKQKFDEVIGSKNEFKNQVGQLTNELESIKKSAKGNEELTQAIQELQNKNQDWESKYNLNQIDNKVTLFGMQNKAVDPSDLAKFLDYTKLSLDEDGNVQGLKEQIDGLKESKAYLFEQVKQTNNNTATNPVNVVVNKDLDEQYNDAIKSGNQALAIALKNKMFFGK